MYDPVTIDASTVLVPLLLAYLVAIAVPAVRRRFGLTVHRLTTLTALVGYGAAVVDITLFPIIRYPDSYWRTPWWDMIHPIPFLVDAPSFWANVVMMVPLGILLPLLWGRTDSLRRIATYGALTSAAIESTQLVIGLTLGSRRTVDINDLMANTAGAVLGYLLLRLALRSRPLRAVLHRTASSGGSRP